MTIIAGFGYRAAASAASLQDAYARACAATGQAARAQMLATPADKAETAPFRAFATALDLPVHPVPAKALRAQRTLSQSTVSQTARGTGSVAEASALAALGDDAYLLTARIISGDHMATCALATGDIK